MKRNRYIDETIPRIYQRQALDIMLFAFIEAYQLARPSVTLKEAAGAFIKRFNISPDLYDIDHALRTYHRVNKDSIDEKKSG